MSNNYAPVLNAAYCRATAFWLCVAAIVFALLYAVGSMLFMPFVGWEAFILSLAFALPAAACASLILFWRGRSERAIAHREAILLSVLGIIAGRCLTGTMAYMIFKDRLPNAGAEALFLAWISMAYTFCIPELIAGVIASMLHRRLYRQQAATASPT